MKEEQKHTPYYYVDNQFGDRYCLMDGNDMSKNGAYRMLDEIKRVSSLTKENERLKEWQESATGVLNKWYKCSEFLAEKSLVTLGDNYSEKCLEVLKSLTEQVEKLNKEYTELAIKFEDKNFELSQLKAERKELVEALREALPMMHDFSVSGIADREYRKSVQAIEQKIKALLSHKQEVGKNS